MNLIKQIIFLSLCLLCSFNCSSDSTSINKGQITHPGGRGTVSSSNISTVTYNDKFAVDVKFKEGELLQSSISFSNVIRADNMRAELIEDWVIGGDTLLFSRLVESSGGDVILQSYKSSPGSYIKVVAPLEGPTKISFDTLLFLKDTRFQDAPDFSDSILLIDGFFEFQLET